MSTDIPSGFLELIHDIQLSNEKLVFPTVQGLEEITLDDFTGEKYFVDASRPFIMMMCTIPLWFILMLMSKKHCFDSWPCATSPFCGVISIIVLVGTSLIFLAISYAGNVALQDGLADYAASSVVAAAALNGFKAQFEPIEVATAAVETTSCLAASAGDANFTEAVQIITLGAEQITASLQTAFALSDDVVNAADVGADAIIRSLEWIDIVFILLTVLMAITSVVMGVASYRAYKSKTSTKGEEDTCSSACFTIVYTFGVLVVLIIWIIAAVLAVPTYVGADLCVGDATANLQDGLKRSIVSGTDVSIDSFDLCEVTNTSFETAEQQLGNIACFYSECRGELFVLNEINQTEDLEALQVLTSFVSLGLNETNCTTQLDSLETQVAAIIDELNNNLDIDCEDLGPIFIETVEVSLCEEIVAGVATISFCWGISASFIMLTMVMGLVNSKKSINQVLKETRKRLKRKQKEDRRSMRRINQAVEVQVAEEFEEDAEEDEAEPEETEHSNKKYERQKNLRRQLEEEPEEYDDDMPDLGGVRETFASKRSSASINF